MSLQCERCHLQFMKLSDLKRHYHRKRICQGLHSNSSYEDLLKKLEKPEGVKDENKKVYKCKYCEHEYKWHSSLSTHYKTCKAKPQDAQTGSIMKELNKLKHQVEQLSQDVDRLKRANSPSMEVPVDPDMRLNAFGAEDLSHISDNMLHKHVLNSIRGMTDMFEHIHFHESYPENRNIIWKSTKNELVYTYNGQKWIETDLRHAIHVAMTRVHALFSQFLTSKLDAENASDNDKEKYQEAFYYWCEIMKTKQIMHKDFYQHERNMKILVRLKTQELLLAER